jgi:5-methylcytosine-specific restriction endonuclease McrA
MTKHFNIGDKIGMITVLSEFEREDFSKKRMFNCICDCGNLVVKNISGLVKAVKMNYQNTSCGCVKGGQNIDKLLAEKNGDKFYFTGKPCDRGHIAKRRLLGSACVECQKENDIKNRHKRAEYFKQYQLDNKEQYRQSCVRYNEKNREKRREQDRIRKQDPKVKAKRAEYERARRQNKRAGKGNIKKSDIDLLLENQKGKCASCLVKLKNFHVDHIMPLFLNGENEIKNLQVLCPTCNLKKGKLDPFEWANKNGKLL